MSLYTELDFTVNASTVTSSLLETRSGVTDRNEAQMRRKNPTVVTVFLGQDIRQREPGAVQTLHGSQLYTLGGLMVATLSAVLLFALVYYQCSRRSRRYDLLHDGVGEPEQHRCIHNAREHYEHVYKPSVFLDDEYENTFSGVSVPLLHEVSRV